LPPKYNYSSTQCIFHDIKFSVLICYHQYIYEGPLPSKLISNHPAYFNNSIGSPAILGDREEDGGADDGASDFNYNSENQNQKQKIAERMLGWQMAYGRAEDVGAPNYDKEVSHNHIPMLSGGQEVVQLGSSVILFSTPTPNP